VIVLFVIHYYLVNVANRYTILDEKSKKTTKTNTYMKYRHHW